MKLIIDIPERDYDLACKYPNALIATYAHYIKDGIPYEERQKGKWIKEEGTGLVGCSHCHIIWLRGKTAFCPNCGADMRKETENE